VLGYGGQRGPVNVITRDFWQGGVEREGKRAECDFLFCRSFVKKLYLKCKKLFVYKYCIVYDLDFSK